MTGRRLHTLPRHPINVALDFPSRVFHIITTYWRVTGGKGGKGLGKGGAKRHRKILRDNIQGITKPAIRRLARRGGVKRISASKFLCPYLCIPYPSVSTLANLPHQWSMRRPVVFWRPSSKVLFVMLSHIPSTPSERRSLPSMSYMHSRDKAVPSMVSVVRCWMLDSSSAMLFTNGVAQWVWVLLFGVIVSYGYGVSGIVDKVLRDNWLLTKHVYCLPSSPVTCFYSQFVTLMVCHLPLGLTLMNTSIELRV